MLKIAKFLSFLLFFILLGSFFVKEALAACPNSCLSAPLQHRCKISGCMDCPGCSSSTPDSEKPKANSFFGLINPPPGVKEYGQGDFQIGLVKFANNLLKLIIGAAGLFAFFNIIIAGYTFLGAGGDPKKIEQAWAKIWQSLLGLLFVAGSFVLAGIFGWLIFGDARAILIPKIYGP